MDTAQPADHRNRPRRGQRRGIRSLAGLVGVVVLAGAACEALARAGGGGGFGGGGGGGGGFGGGGGGGDLLFWLVVLCIRYPILGIPLAGLGVVGILLFKYGRGDARLGRVIRRGQRSRDRLASAFATQRLKDKDPDFDEKAFLKRVKGGFVKLQQAWSNQDLSGVRAFLSDGVHERFNLQIDEQKLRGFRNRMKDVRVLDTWVAELTTNAHFDVLTVRITASAVDYREDLRTGRRLSGTTRPGEFTEYWSLLRRRDAKTVADKPGLLEGHCPNCGAEVSVNASSRCEYCQAHLTSCARDWVLAEITQASVWQPTAGREVPGFDRLASRDAGLTLQHVEDRASVMVYRRFAAAREARVEPLACIATPEYVRQFTAELPAPDAPDRTWYGDCSVGSVETVGMIPTREADVALVRVRWSATRLGHDSGEIREVAEGGTFAALFVLTRRPDAVTNVDETVSSAHCPACGAPAEGDRGGSCAFCGTVLNDGSDWLLAATPSLGSSQAGTLIARARALGAQSTVSGARARDARSGAPAQRGLLAWLVSISISDGQVDRAQRRSLRALAHKCAVPEEELDRMIEGARSGNTEPPRPESGSQARQWLTEMVRLALSDGRIHRKERRVLRDVGEELSMSAYDVDQLITKEKLALARRARQDIDREHRSRRRDPSLAAAM